MSVSEQDLEELKEIYFKLYKRVLNNDEALYIATQLINLFNVIAKPVPKIDIPQEKVENEVK